MHMRINLLGVEINEDDSIIWTARSNTVKDLIQLEDAPRSRGLTHEQLWLP